MRAPAWCSAFAWPLKACEFLPQQSIVFDGALGTLATEVELAGSAVFIGVETDGCPHTAIRDARKMRGARPLLFSNQKTGQGLADIIDFTEPGVLLPVIVLLAYLAWRALRRSS